MGDYWLSLELMKNYDDKIHSRLNYMEEILNNALFNENKEKYLSGLEIENTGHMVSVQK